VVVLGHDLRTEWGAGAGASLILNLLMVKGSELI